MYTSKTLNDKWIIENIFPRKRDGFFVEAGAGHPIHNSSTYILEKDYGWKGILIEPNSNFKAELDLRRNAIVCTSCLFSEKETVDFLQPYGGKGGIEKLIRHKDTKGKLVTKETKTLDSVLDEFITPDKIIDYLCLDTEGSEFEILKNFPFNKWKIRAISIEGHECDDFLVAIGYRQVSNPFHNLTYESYFYCDI